MSTRRRPRPAEERLRRLLVVLPWLMERGSAPVAEVAARFDLTEAELAADLELVSMCGLPPYVDELIDVFIDEGTVHVGVPRLFTRALRLNAVEAFELVVAGRAAMEMPGADPDGPLGRGLAKLEAHLGIEPAAVAVDLERPATADRLADATRRAEELRVRYWSASNDATTDRTIVPRQVFADRGNWYVLADDDRSGERRTFRVDRIESLEPTGRFHDPTDDPLPPPGEWFRDAGLERVTLRLAPAAGWVVERYPVDDVRPVEGVDGVPDGTLEVVVPVASRRWLERLLVRLGPLAEVVTPSPGAEAAGDGEAGDGTGLDAGIGAAAAARVLAVYAGSDRAGDGATVATDERS